MEYSFPKSPFSPPTPATPGDLENRKSLLGNVGDEIRGRVQKKSRVRGSREEEFSYERMLSSEEKLFAERRKMTERLMTQAREMTEQVDGGRPKILCYVALLEAYQQMDRPRGEILDQLLVLTAKSVEGTTLNFPENVTLLEDSCFQMLDDADCTEQHVNRLAEIMSVTSGMSRTPIEAHILAWRARQYLPVDEEQQRILEETAGLLPPRQGILTDRGLARLKMAQGLDPKIELQEAKRLAKQDQATQDDGVKMFLTLLQEVGQYDKALSWTEHITDINLGYDYSYALAQDAHAPLQVRQLAIQKAREFAARQDHLNKAWERYAKIAPLEAQLNIQQSIDVQARLEEAKAFEFGYERANQCIYLAAVQTAYGESADVFLAQVFRECAQEEDRDYAILHAAMTTHNFGCKTPVFVDALLSNIKEIDVDDDMYAFRSGDLCHLLPPVYPELLEDYLIAIKNSLMKPESRHIKNLLATYVPDVTRAAVALYRLNTQNG